MRTQNFTTMSDNDGGKSRPPDGKTMEGMIFNANDILAKAISSETNGIPKELFQKCHGIMIISSLQLGLVLTNCVGSGIAIARDQTTGMWSLPCACSLSGLGIGLFVGGAHSDLIVFALEKAAMDEFVEGNLFMSKDRMGAEIGSFDRDAKPDLEGNTVAVSYSKGAFVGAAIHGANITVDIAENSFFYDREVSAKELFEMPSSLSLTMPDDKATVMDDVYAKLVILAEKRESNEKSSAAL